MDGAFERNATALLHGLIRSRRSVRRYRTEPVPDELLRQLIETAIWAPSAHNRQPWRFVLLDSDARRRLARTMATRLKADRTADGDDPDAIAADAARSVARITGAPAALLICLTVAEMDAYPDARRAAAERAMAMQSTAMAVQNLLLAAHAEGLGAAWMCAPLFCPDTARAALSLPTEFEPQALVTLGWPEGPARPRARKPVEDAIWVPPALRDGA